MLLIEYFAAHVLRRRMRSRRWARRPPFATHEHADKISDELPKVGRKKKPDRALLTRLQQCRLRATPKAWFDQLPHTHVALDDAIEQGALFCNMLRSLRGK